MTSLQLPSGRGRHREGGTFHVSARVDCAMRALAELASTDALGEWTKAEHLARAHDIPMKFLEGILRSLRQAGLVQSQRGAEGGYRLARPAGDVTVGEVIRAMDGPMAVVRGHDPQDVAYAGAARHVGAVWVAVREVVAEVVDHVTVADVVAGLVPLPGSLRP